jgi:hypothetical protein
MRIAGRSIGDLGAKFFDIPDPIFYISQMQFFIKNVFGEQDT